LITLKLLGGAVLEGDAGPLTGRVAQRRRIALLAYLAVARGRPVSRERLLALLWPETEPGRARHLLSDSVYIIRKELGETAVLSAGDDLELDPALLTSDVEQFEHALAAGTLEQAAAHYQGPFLDGFHIDDAPDFERWLDSEQDRLSRSYARLLQQLAEEHEQAGNPAWAVEWWRRLAAHEPSSGRVALRVMQALADAGDRAGAIQHARAHIVLLREEFGIEPDPPVLELLERLTTSEPRSDRPPSTAEPPVVTIVATQPPSAAGIPSPWRRRRIAFTGIVVMVAAAVLVGAWLSTRPVERQPVLVADATGDTLLGDFVAERLRQGLARSPHIRIVGRSAISATLQRMGRNPDVRLVPAIAREVALREGVKAFVQVDVHRSGDAYYLSAALVEAGSEELTDSERAIARNATEVVAATDRLGESVRKRFGESLASIASTARLYPVTTDSISAVIKYYEGFLAYRLRGDVRRALELTEEAIAIDATFAHAYLQLSSLLSASGARDARAVNALLKAYALRDKLSPYERFNVEGDYYANIQGDFVKAVSRYRDHIVEAKKFPPGEVVTSFLGLAHLHVLLEDYGEAERVLHESRTWYPGPFNQALLARVLYTKGRESELNDVLVEAQQRFPRHPWLETARAHLSAAAGDFTLAHERAMRIDTRPAIPFGLRTAALFDAVQGRVSEATGHLRELRTELLAHGFTAPASRVAWAAARLQLLAGDTAAANREIGEFLKEQPLESLAAAGQPALLMAHFYAQSGQLERARDLLHEHTELAAPELRSVDDWLLRRARAEVMIASGKPSAALGELRPRFLHVWRHEWFEEPFMPVANRPELARAYDMAGQADSAIVIFERYLNTRALYRAELDAFELAHAYQRLAALYEARSNFTRAAEYYRLLAQLWSNADPSMRRLAEEAQLRAEELRN
jgi:DNA-binding SARP family transcriptional activator